MDEEKTIATTPFTEQNVHASEEQVQQKRGVSSLFKRLISSTNVEERGIVPVPVEERTNRRTYTIVDCSLISV